ncbi:MAG: vWA domain-containing protein [Arenicellales bacterium]
MKSKILAIALFSTTVAGVALYPVYQSTGGVTPVKHNPLKIPATNLVANDSNRIDVVFVLDTTGSMSGLIQAAKEKIWSIATTMASANSAPEIRVGLVAYRDRGDAYVTKTIDLSSDLDTVYATLMDFQAKGGGDGPESVNQALNDAVEGMSWSQDKQAYKVVFLVGDASPHMDYQDDVKYPVSLAAAREKNIVINTIQAGSSSSTTKDWQQIAQLGHGQYFQVGQSGNAVAIASPFDEEIAKLSKKLDDTRLYYGNEEEKARQVKKIESTDKLHASASVETRARRATFNASKSGSVNFLGEGELVDDIGSGRVDLSSIKKDELPKSLQALAPAAQKAMVSEMAERRNELQSGIRQLAEKRTKYLKKKVKDSGGAKDSLDEKVYSAIREQAGKLGMTYEKDSADY